MESKIQNDSTEVLHENKTKKIITNIDEVNTVVSDIEYINVKPTAENIEPSQELLNTLGLMKVLNSTEKKDHSVEKSYSCTQCPTKFGSQRELTVHVRKHAENSKPHTRQLRKHFATHGTEESSEKYKNTRTGFKNYCCSQCERRFYNRCDLKRHERVHTGEKPYTCLICGGRFQQAYSLTLHKVAHTGVRSYNCNICQKSFGRADVLKRHRYVHEINKPHSCQHCSRTFARQSQLVTHLKREH